MSIHNFELTLDSKAKSMGGDKYLSKENKPFYIPQKYSRENKEVSTKLEMAISDLPQEGGQTIAFKLLQAAKSKGDDRYTCLDQEQWVGDIYLPALFRNEQKTVYLSILKG